MRQTLSVVLATYNEEKNLSSCLDSIKDIADEIVIVDGKSTDKTVEIAKKFGARVKSTTNKPNFHINKQMAIEMATKDWILQLDADEHVSKEQKTEILDILSKNPKENGFWMPRKNLFLGRFLMKGGQYPDYTLRLYRKGKGRLPQKDVHEQAEVSGKVGYLKSALLHYPYKSFSHYLRKWDLYNNLFASQIAKEQKPKNFLLKIFYAFAYLVLKPSHWLLTTYIRHKGFMDGWQGLVFSLFSAIRFPVSYIKYIGWYKLSIFVVILLASIIRLWNYPDRWGLGGDDSREALIALEAIKRHELPFVGPFSSAGPFVFGGLFYWLIILSYLILPFYMGAPWVFLEILSIVTVFVLIYMGKSLVDEKFSIILGILAAFSPQLVVRSLALGPHTFIATFSALTLICFLLLWKKKKLVFAFLMGASIGIALSMHYQAINLFVFFVALFFIFGFSLRKKILSLLLAGFGFLIPSLPILYWDSYQGFANIRNILDYFLIGQYRIYVPNSWKLFLFKDFSSYWAFVAGNYQVIGLILFLGSVLLFLFLTLKRKLSKEFQLIGFLFFFMIFLNRFYKGERSEGYLLYFLPFILIFTSFLIYKIFSLNIKFSKVFAVSILVLIIFANCTYIYKVLNFKSPRPAYEEVIKNLSINFPDEKFSIFDYKYKFYNSSMPLSLIASFNNLSDVNGKKIALSCYGVKYDCPKQSLPIVNDKHVLLVDISKIQGTDFNKKIWVNVNQPSVYEDLIGWLNKHQLKSTFDLKKYIMERI